VIVFGVLVVVTVLAAGATALVAHRFRGSDLFAPTVRPGRLRRALRHHPAIRRLLDAPPAEAAASLLVAAAVLAVTAAAFVVGALWLMVRAEAGLVEADGPIARWAAEHAEPWATEVFRWISRLGGTEALVVLAVLVTVVGWRRSPRPALPVFVAIVVGGQFALSNAVKWLVDRARPEVLQLTGHAGASFPSGHATAAAASYACFALLLGRGRSRSVRVLLAALAGGITAAVGATRVLLGVHWSTDVVAGTILGWAWFALWSAVFGGRRLRFVAPDVVEEATGAPSRVAGSSSPR
jgi:undecaprenyl-diphosphatase